MESSKFNQSPLVVRLFEAVVHFLDIGLGDLDVFIFAALVLTSFATAALIQNIATSFTKEDRLPNADDKTRRANSYNECLPAALFLLSPATIGGEIALSTQGFQVELDFLCICRLGNGTHCRRVSVMPTVH